MTVIGEPAGSREISLGLVFAAAVALCAVLYGVFLLVRDDPGEKPYLRVVGASFIFNYRVSDVYMGFSAVPERPFPIGSILQVRFPDPEGGEPFVVEDRLSLADRRVSLRSPSLRGVEAGKPYRVEMRLLDRETRAPFWEHGFEIRSGIGDEVVPDRPLTVGAGYQRPIE